MAFAVAAALVAGGGLGDGPQDKVPGPVVADEPTGVSVGVEVRRDRFHYRFENPSTFDTAELVPHYFEQRYDTDNVWIGARVRYRVGGLIWETAGAFTPRTTGLGEDYDTFFNPDGNVIVYGTTADTDVRSLRLAQTMDVGQLSGFRLRVGYQYRRDTSDFRPSYTTIERTQPPSSEQFWNADRETTISELHEVRLGIARSFAPPGRWSFSVGADLTPVTLARLTTLLPDKYPGQPIVFMAKSLSAAASANARVRVGPAVVGLKAGYVGSWSYRSTSQFNRHGVGGELHVSFGL